MLLNIPGSTGPELKGKLVANRGGCGPLLPIGSHFFPCGTGQTALVVLAVAGWLLWMTGIILIFLVYLQWRRIKNAIRNLPKRGEERRRKQSFWARRNRHKKSSPGKSEELQYVGVQRVKLVFWLICHAIFLRAGVGTLSCCGRTGCQGFKGPFPSAFLDKFPIPSGWKELAAKVKGNRKS